MELNTEEIIKALECHLKTEKENTCKYCINCPASEYDLCEGVTTDDCVDVMFTATLALINSQEQKIFELENRLKECENGYEETLHLERAKIKKLTNERDTFKECAYNLQAYVYSIAEKVSDGYELSAAKASAEMEMWRNVALEKKRLTDENESLRAELEQRPPKLIITKLPKKGE